MILSDKLKISKKEWDSLPSSKKKILRKSLKKTLYNLQNCSVNIIGGKCTKRDGDAFTDGEGKDACLHCDFAKNEINLLQRTKKGYSLERGNLSLLKLLSLPYKNSTSYPSIPKIAFRWGKLTDKDKAEQQKKVVKDWLSYGYGQITAAPRSGKTVIAVAISTVLKTRTVVITHQKELLDQFYNTYTSLTNIRYLEKKYGRTLIMINPKEDEVDDLFIVLYTYQRFIHNDKVKKIKRKFGLLIVDEVHRLAAKAFSKVISGFYARYRLGVTATPNRKDGLHFVSDAIIGPVVVKAMSEQLTCSVIKTETGRNYRNFVQWTTIINWLTKDEERNALIADCAIKDLKSKYKIVIPVDRVAHVNTLTSLILERDETIKIGYMHGSTSPKIRKETVEKAKIGDIDVLIATAKLIKEGLDIPPFSCIYSIMPQGNEENIYQQVSRIRTNYPNKNNPMIRHFVDNIGVSAACFKIAMRVYSRLEFHVE